MQTVVPPDRAAEVERELTAPQAASCYQPALPIYSVRSPEALLWDFYMDIESMRRDAAIALPLTWVMGAIAHAEWTVEANSIQVAEFAAQQIQWFWSNAVGRLQEESYCWGWCPGELTYDVRDALLVQSRFDTFHPQDADPLVRHSKPVGIQIRNVEGGHKNLWAWREDVPNKGFWYSHRARHGMRRGQSQIRPAWRHWRRLTGRDGGEEIVDLGVYRNGVGDTVVRHPNQTYKARSGDAVPWQGSGQTHTRDEARMIAENRKGGAGIAISSERYANGQPLWDIEVLPSTVNAEQLVAYVEYLERKCSKAIGVPPELFEAAKTGSGYSGRAIPLQGFLVAQQRPLDDITRAWCEQVGQPLAKWNFGPDSWLRITPVPLFESYRKAAWDGPDGGQSPMVPGGFAPPGQPADGPPDDGGGEAFLSTDVEWWELDQ